MSDPRPGPTAPAKESTAWVYEGVWAVLAGLFKTPREGPTLPVRAGEACDTFHPAPGYLRYLKLWFWIGLVIVDGSIAIAWLLIATANRQLGLALAVPALLLATLPDVVAYLAIHLRYDTMWYVLTEHSMRLRRGIWVIGEVTITYENIQNVAVRSGPVQRLFGIADVAVETAGAGASHGEPSRAVSNRGLIQGVADAARIRELIMLRVRHSTTAGLGEEPRPDASTAARGAWTGAHNALLRDIRDELRALHSAR